LGMTKEAIDKLPQGYIKEEALRRYNIYEENMKVYHKEKKFIETVKMVINTPFNPKTCGKQTASIGGGRLEMYRAPRAYQLLESRRDYEYEAVNLEDAET
jgi:hypothetical protein